MEKNGEGFNGCVCCACVERTGDLGDVVSYVVLVAYLSVIGLLIVSPFNNDSSCYYCTCFYFIQSILVLSWSKDAKKIKQGVGKSSKKSKSSLKRK